MRVWSSRAVVRSPGAAGVSHDNQNTKRAHFEGPGLQKHHQNSTRRHPEREERICGGRGKKRAKFWAVLGRAVLGRSVGGKGGPRATQQTHTNTQQVKIWPKSVLAKLGFGLKSAIPPKH